MKALMLVPLALALSLAVPVASATGLPEVTECEGSAVQRAVCAVEETIEAIGPIVDPLAGFAAEEAKWALGVACEAIEHIVGPTCRNIAALDLDLGLGA